MTNCETCGTEVSQPRFGRRREYCSATCRQKAYRHRGSFLADLGRETIEEAMPGELAAAGVTPYDVAASVIRGGWNNSTLDELSPRTRAQVLKADAEYELEGRQQEAERRARSEDLRMRSIVAAFEAAQERGEAVSLVEELRTGGRNVGMTHRERVEYVSALMDVEEARRQARAYQMVNQILEGLGGVEGFTTVAADTSALREVDASEAAAMQQRAEQRKMMREIAGQEIRHDKRLDKFGRGGGRRG